MQESTRKSSRGYIGEDAAREKIRHYCAYQERCHSEVKQKLFDFGLYPEQVAELLAELIQENYLNEERFAVQFAGGRFRMKQWGRQKIRYALKAKGISDYCIRLALQSIPGDAYEQTLEKLAAAKWHSLRKETQAFARQQKLRNYLLQRGFEQDLIADCIKNISNHGG